MRKRNRRIWALLLSFVMVLACMPMSAFADDTEDGWGFTNPTSLWPGKSYGVKIEKYDETLGYSIRAKLIDVTTSDPSVVGLKKYTVRTSYSQGDDDGLTDLGTSVSYIFNMMPKMPGEAVITAEYLVDGESEPRTMTQTVIVEKYPNHIKSLKVNGKAVNVSKNKYYYCKENYKKTAFKVKFALKKGWKITSLKGTLYSDYKDDKYFKVTKKMITGKKKISFPKTWDICTIEINMTNGDKTISYKIDMER